MSLFFVIYINNISNHTVSTVEQLAADDILFFIAYHAETLAGELNSYLKANLNGHPYVTLSRSELGSKSSIFMGNDKIISLTNLFQHLLSPEKLPKWKIKFIFYIFSEKFSNQCKEQTAL